MTNSKELDVLFNWTSDLRKSKTELEKVSPTFCLAKWLHVTLHLHKGMTHSCHHPPTHKITLLNLASNPSGLHNTPEKMYERKQMLAGKQPKGCAYCWNIENANSNAISDRVMKSASDWSYPYANTVTQQGLGYKISPRYMEVSFSSLCNFSCSYCSADFSSKWQREIEQHGPYHTKNGNLTSPNIAEENNPYLDAFWKWWPNLKDELHVFRITGGEPLLSKNTWKILDDLDVNPAPHLQMAINTNLGVPTEIIFQLITKLKKLVADKKIADVCIFASIDAMGKDAELIRHGLNADLFFTHLNIILKEIPTLRVVIMSTYSALSVPSFSQLLEKVLEYRKVFRSIQRPNPLDISISYLRHPEHLSIKILNPDLIKIAMESLSFMERNSLCIDSNPTGFTENEINSMKNVIEWFKTPIDLKKQEFLRTQFCNFYSQHDLRRSTNSNKTIQALLSLAT